jgi:transposase
MNWLPAKEPFMLQAHGLREIPAETRKVAQAAFPNGSLLMALQDELGAVYTDEQFTDLFSERGQPAESPAELALVTVLQFVEGLTDRQAADAVRGRIDWKYALGLELTDPGFDYSILSEFRARLLAGGAEERLLTTLLNLFRERDLLKAGGRQRTDSTHVLAAIRHLNRLELVGESMRYALNELAQSVPGWLIELAPADWYERYGRRFDSFHLPDSRDKRQALSQQIGADGYWLMSRAFAPDAPPTIRSAQCLDVLRRIWMQQYYVDASGSEPRVCLRESDDLPPAEKRIASPYDLDARYARHNDKEWVGYRTHLTETCDADAPIHLITHVETVLAPTQDVEVSETIHADLAEQDLKPKEHFVDAAYLSANLLVKAARDDGIEMIGPVTKLQDVSWQAREKTGYDASRFNIDWDAKRVTCPQGQTSARWVENVKDRTGNAVIHVLFAAATCQACPARALCTHSQNEGRNMQLRPREQHEALQQARTEQTAEAWAQKYRPRLGIEGTISQAVRGFELRENRYLGLAKTHLQAVALATAIDLCRFWDYLNGSGLKQTRTSPFLALAG